MATTSTREFHVYSKRTYALVLIATPEWTDLYKHAMRPATGGGTTQLIVLAKHHELSRLFLLLRAAASATALERTGTARH